MQRLLFESAVRATLIAAIIALVLCVMRIKTAAARHAVWAGVVLVMLSLPAWVAWGPRASLPVLPRGAAQTAIAMRPVVDGSATARIPLHTKTAVPQPFVWRWPAFLAGVYPLGLCALLVRLAIGTVRVRWLLRGVVLRDGRLTHASCSTPVTVGWLRPSIILPVDWSVWPQARLDAILVHEREHARRRDPLVQWIALLNRALFWFHPLAWWLERRLSGLAEEACDAAVLARGYDPRDYSEYLLDLARSVERAGRRIDALGMAMPGAFLPQRIRRMLSGAPAPRVSRPRMACTVAVCAVAAAILAAGTLVRAQSKAEPSPTFEVASVRPSDPRTGVNPGGGVPFPRLEHRRLTYSGTLFAMILGAYDVNGCYPFGISCRLLSGGPAWIQKDRFDIQARAPESSPDYTFDQLIEGQAPQLQLMLRALLAERFGLKVHREQKELSIYALTVAKKGPKLKPAAGEMNKLPDGTMAKRRTLMFTVPRKPDGEFDERKRQIIVRNESIQALSNTLSIVLDRPVVNRTGIDGEFDITLEYEPDIADSPAAVGPPGDPVGLMFGSSFFAALQDQLGLKLESTKGLVDVLVIDRAAKPSDN